VTKPLYSTRMAIAVSVVLGSIVPIPPPQQNLWVVSGSGSRPSV
jgi:hypothetical protein